MPAMVAMNVQGVVVRVHGVAQDLTDTVERRRRASSLLVSFHRDRDVLDAVLADVGGDLVIQLLVLEVVMIVQGSNERSATQPT